MDRVRARIAGRLSLMLVGVLLVYSMGGRGAISPIASADELAAALSMPEQRVVDLVNVERAKAGLPPLSVSAPLVDSARGYAAYMAAANFFSHTGPDGSTLDTRDGAAGYREYTFLAENLAAGHTTPEAAMAGWMASPGHRANILSPQGREIGVGYTSGGSYGHYWVQEFGARAAASSAAAASAPSAATSGDAGWTAPATGHTVSGEWLVFLRSNGGVDNFGYPRSGAIADPLAGGRPAQYFQRVVLEYHPENPPAYRIQRRLLGDILYPGADAPASPADAPPGAAHYFPFTPDGPSGLGHFVADYTRSGQPIHFKQYFDAHGGVTAFGYPKEEPKLRDGRWTQRFQAAVFEYHPEHDREGVVAETNVPHRDYRVQLALLGDEYIGRNALPFR